MYAGIYTAKVSKDGYDTFEKVVDVTYSNTLEVSLFVSVTSPILDLTDSNENGNTPVITAPRRVLTVNSNVDSYNIEIVDESDEVIHKGFVSSKEIKIPIMYSGNYRVKISKDDYISLEEEVDLTYSNTLDIVLYAVANNPIFDENVDGNDKLPIIPRANLDVYVRQYGYWLSVDNMTDDILVFSEYIDGRESNIKLFTGKKYLVTISKDKYKVKYFEIDVNSDYQIATELELIEMYKEKPIDNHEDNEIEKENNEDIIFEYDVVASDEVLEISYIDFKVNSDEIKLVGDNAEVVVKTTNNVLTTADNDTIYIGVEELKKLYSYSGFEIMEQEGVLHITNEYYNITIDVDNNEVYVNEKHYVLLDDNNEIIGMGEDIEEKSLIPLRYYTAVLGYDIELGENSAVVKYKGE